jgi:hypothetical protein
MKDVLEYLFGRLKDKRPITHNVGGQEYAVQQDGTLGAPVRELAPQWDKPMFGVTTLSGLADLYKANVDEFNTAGPVGLHIANYREVRIVAIQADAFGRRHVFAKAVHTLNVPFVFDKYYTSPEEFLIAFRASFLFNEEAVKVQQLCSQVGAGEAVAVSDDGISQEVVTKSGTVTKASVTLPASGIPLIPWRTFRETDPVVSKFLLRMKGAKEGPPHIALFEIDAMWELETVGSIAHWLKKNIPGATIIA